MQVSYKNRKICQNNSNSVCFEVDIHWLYHNPGIQTYTQAKQAKITWKKVEFQEHWTEKYCVQNKGSIINAIINEVCVKRV